MPFDARALLRDLFQTPDSAATCPRGRPAPPSTREAIPAEAGEPADRMAAWEARWRKSPQLVPPPKPCGWCRSSVFWKSIHGVYVCSNCHPPAYPALAEMWLQLVATDDGPQLVRLKVAPRPE